MKILLLPPYFTPEQMASSHLDEHRYEAFANEGYKMLLYTPYPTRGIDNKVREEYKKRKKETMYNGMLEINRFSMFREGKNPVVRALRYMLCWCKQFYYGCKAKEIDLIYLVSTPPIQGALGGLLKKVKKVPFVYNLQDIFPDSLVATGLAKKDGLLWKIGRLIEDFTYRNADKIIVISEDFKRNIMDKGVPEEKIIVVYNWVDEKAIAPVAKQDNPLFEEFSIKRDKFNVVYAGNLGYAQNVKIILETASVLKVYDNIQFLIFGTGGMELEYKKYVYDHNISNVIFFPIQSHEKVSQVYGVGNICIVSCKEGLGGSAMPSKTWSIMSSGRAVLANFEEGELKNILESNQCGIFTKAGDKEALMQAIVNLYNDRKLCEKLGNNGREFIIKHLTRDVGTKKYLDVINKITNKLN